MRHEGKHRVKAERNAQFADSQDLTDPIRESWAVVASFYSALHYVEEFFAKYGNPCRSHTDRNTQFKADIRIRTAYASYEYLYSISRTARYKCEPLPEKVYQKYAKPRLLFVKQQIDHAMNAAARAQESGGR